MRRAVWLSIGLLALQTLTFCTKKEWSLQTKKTPAHIFNLGGTQNEEAKAVIATADGGYLVLANTQSTDGAIEGKSTSDYDLWLLKFDQTHTLLWQKTIGHAGNDKGNKIVPASDGGFLIAGSTQDLSQGQNNTTQIWLIKIDAQANLLWEKTYGYQGIDTAYDIIKTSDGGFLISGIIDVTASNGAGNVQAKTQKHAGGDFWVLKVDPIGDLQWSQYYGGTYTDTAYSAVQTPDGGYFILGTSDSEDVDVSKNRGTYDLWLVRIDRRGTLLWEKNFGGSQIDEGVKILALENTNVLIAGTTRSTDQLIGQNKGGADVWIVQIDSQSDIIWEKTYGGSSFDLTTNLLKTPNNNFIITGNSRSADQDLTQNNGYNDAWVFQIDPNGKIAWQSTLGGSQIDTAVDATTLNNGTIIVVGNSNSDLDPDRPNQGFTDVLIFSIQ